MRTLFQNQWLKWGSVFLLAALVLAGAYYYQTMSLGKVRAAGLSIASSTRFITGNSDYLSKTYGTTATDRKKGTISFWYKRGALGSGPTGDYLVASSYGTMDGSTKELFFGFNQDDQFDIYWFTSGASPSSELRVVTTQVFRDPSAFGHIVFSWDTTQATAADRWSLYNNGVKITSFASVTNPPQNLPVPFAVSGIASCFGIGAESGSCNTDYFDGYLSDAYFVDGQQLTPSSFGEYDANGYWRPISYTGTYGINGFKFAFGTGSALGTDTSVSDTILDHSGYTATAPLGGTADNAKDNSSGTVVTTTSIPTDSQVIVKYDAGSAQSVGGVFVVGYKQNYAGADGVSYKVQYSTNDSDWTTYGSSVSVSPGNVAANKEIKGGTISARYWRLAANQNHDATVTVADFLLYSTLSNDFATSSSMTAALNQMTDTPTNSFITLDPIRPSSLYSSGLATLTAGNLTADDTSANTTTGFRSSSPIDIVPKSYWEVKLGGVSNQAPFYDYPRLGLAKTSYTGNGWGDPGGVSSQNMISYRLEEGYTIQNDSLVASYTTPVTGDTMMFAYDAATGKVWMGNNGTWFNSGNPAAGTGQVITLSTSDQWWFSGSVNDYSNINGTPITANFGQGGQASLTYDSASGGTFKYTPPSGFKALSTANMATPTITQPNNYFNSVIYTGTGAAQNVLNSSTSPVTIAGFQPDLVWIKDRTSALMHNIFDSARLVYPYWSSNASTVETGGASTTLTAFLSNGFTLGTNALFNTSGNNYVSWLWKESSTSGVDVVTYTGDNTSNRTISHSLGKAPDFVLVKRRDAVGDGYVWHRGLTGAAYFLKADSNTFTQTNTNTPWGTGGWTSSTFMVTNNSTNNANASGGTYVSYLFASTTGFSDFGSYTGNGSDDGPFIYTGFKPKYVMIHDPNNDNLGFSIWDTARESYNPMGKLMAFYDTSAEPAFASVRAIDILSNGFKIRTSAGGLNTSSRLFIYAAFAEIPFQQSAQPFNLTIASSTRFARESTAYLTRTPSSAGSNQKFTSSSWFKTADVGAGAYNVIFGPTLYVDGSNFAIFSINSDEIFIRFYDGSDRIHLNSTMLFRDPAKWYHIVVAVDTTQATASDRVKVYVDGARVTAWDTATYPSQNYNLSFINSTSYAHYLQKLGSSATYGNSYLSDEYFVDGQQLTPSSFGEYDTNGFWRPKTYSGTYGTNGFHLPLMGTSTAAGIGIDTSGNSNTWTVSGIATTDFVTDSPTNNFWTLDPLMPASLNSTASVGNAVLSNGNLISGGASGRGFRSSSPVDKQGKVYFEVTQLTNGSSYPRPGFAKSAYSGGSWWAPGEVLSQNMYSIRMPDGTLLSNDSLVATYTAFANNDVMMVAYDPATGKFWMGRNGTWFNSGDPAAGTGNVGTLATTDEWWFAGGTLASAASINVNFGQGGQASLTYDSASGGTFKYTPPSGFKALSTANLSAPTIAQPNNYFNAVIYTGTGAALNVLNSSTSPVTIAGFRPDLVWIKDRTSANAHGIFASSTPLYPAWASNASTAEGGAGGTALSSFLSNGFSLGASSTVNTSGNNYVSWLWKKSATSGMDIVTYTGTGSATTIAHSLGKPPAMIIIKRLDSTGDAIVGHQYLHATAPWDDRHLALNSIAAVDGSTFVWNGSGGGGFVPTASVFGVGTDATVNASGGSYVAYLFASTTGFSSFGSYTGNGSADGPFIYTGFKPRFVMVKRTDGVSWWSIQDTARSPYNVITNTLGADLNYDEATITSDMKMDFLSNGFKIRETDAYVNGSAGTYIYAAFADVPFYYSAQPAAAAASTFVAAIAFLLGMTF